MVRGLLPLREMGCLVRLRVSQVCALALLLTAPLAPAEAGDVGEVGASAGFAYHSGRSVAVDAVSGASTAVDADVFTRASVEVAVFGDFGFPVGSGDLGVRTGISLSSGPFFAIAAVPRYRLHLGAVQPWFGAGVGLDFRDGFSRAPYVGFPLALGCDVHLTGDLFLAASADAILANPWGPSRMIDAQEHVDHHNRLSLALGLAYRLF